MRLSFHVDLSDDEAVCKLLGLKLDEYTQCQGCGGGSPWYGVEIVRAEGRWRVLCHRCKSIAGAAMTKVWNDLISDAISNALKDTYEQNHGPQPLSKCRASIKMVMNDDGTWTTTHICGGIEYSDDEWHEVRDSLGYPLKEGYHVRIVGRPYGDVDDYKVEGCAEIGSEIKIIKLMGDGDVQLADGYYYPHSSYR